MWMKLTAYNLAQGPVTWTGRPVKAPVNAIKSMYIVCYNLLQLVT